MRLSTALLIVGVLSWFSTSGLSAQASGGSMPTKTSLSSDPNQKICEDITEIGSRIAKKRECATRAEWAQRRKADREIVDQIQRGQTRPCVNVQHGTGYAPAC